MHMEKLNWLRNRNQRKSPKRPSNDFHLMEEEEVIFSLEEPSSRGRLHKEEQG